MYWCHILKYALMSSIIECILGYVCRLLLCWRNISHYFRGIYIAVCCRVIYSHVSLCVWAYMQCSMTFHLDSINTKCLHRILGYTWMDWESPIVRYYFRSITSITFCCRIIFTFILQGVVTARRLNQSSLGRQRGLQMIPRWSLQRWTARVTRHCVGRMTSLVTPPSSTSITTRTRSPIMGDARWEAFASLPDFLLNFVSLCSIMRDIWWKYCFSYWPCRFRLLYEYLLSVVHGWKSHFCGVGVIIIHFIIIIIVIDINNVFFNFKLTLSPGSGFHQVHGRSREPTERLGDPTPTTPTTGGVGGSAGRSPHSPPHLRHLRHLHSHSGGPRHVLCTMWVVCLLSIGLYTSHLLWYQNYRMHVQVTDHK